MQWRYPEVLPQVLKMCYFSVIDFHNDTNLGENMVHPFNRKLMKKNILQFVLIS